MSEARVLRLDAVPQPAQAPIASLSGVVLSRGGRRLLDGLDLAVRQGGVTALMGPNGAGKSLALRLIAGLIDPDAGRVELAPETTVSLVFQKPVLLRRSVRANLAHALRVHGVPRGDRPARVAALLRLGALEEIADSPARMLSGGEQQRVAMVRALAAEPRLLLLDEPSASLDPRSTAAIEALVAGAVEGGATVVIVTHDTGQARRLADDVVFLARGLVAEAAPAGRFFGGPCSAEARAFLSGRLLV